MMNEDERSLASLQANAQALLDAWFAPPGTPWTERWVFTTNPGVSPETAGYVWRYVAFLILYAGIAAIAAIAPVLKKYKEDKKYGDYLDYEEGVAEQPSNAVDMAMATLMKAEEMMAQMQALTQTVQQAVQPQQQAPAVRQQAAESQQKAASQQSFQQAQAVVDMDSYSTYQTVDGHMVVHRPVSRRGAPAQRAAPVQRLAPAQRAAPAQRRAPVQRITRRYGASRGA